MFGEARTRVYKDMLLDGTEVVNVIYNGKLADGQEKDIYVRYGKGSQWADLQEVKMEYDELSKKYIALIKVAPNDDRINFCFKDEKGHWDNNEGENYTFYSYVEDVENAEDVVSEKSLLEESIPENAEVIFKENAENNMNEAKKMIDGAIEELNILTRQYESERDEKKEEWNAMQSEYIAAVEAQVCAENSKCENMSCEESAETVEVEQKLETSLAVIEQSKNKLMSIMNEPLNLAQIVELLSKVFQTLKDTLSSLVGKKRVSDSDDILL